MSRKNSLLWMGLYAGIVCVYPASVFLEPSDRADLDLSLSLVALMLLASLVILMKHRSRKEAKFAFRLGSGNDFLRSEISGDKPTAKFYE